MESFLGLLNFKLHFPNNSFLLYFFKVSIHNRAEINQKTNPLAQIIWESSD